MGDLPFRYYRHYGFVPSSDSRLPNKAMDYETNG
jgi:hypothetical protein